MPPIIFFGNEQLATGVSTTTPILKKLINAGYHIPALVTNPDNINNSRKYQPIEIIETAKQFNIPVLTPTRLSDIQSQLTSAGAEIGVLVAYGKFVPQTIIDVFPRGIINIHPSLLPKHRGSTPLEGSLLSGDTETGISLMSLVAKMDAGPVYAQEKLLLNGNETKQELADNLAALGGMMLIRDLPLVLSGELEATSQRDEDATYDHRLQKQDGVIVPEDWLNYSAITLERRVRAFAGWPRTTTHLGEQKVIITAAHSINSNGKPGTYSEIDGTIAVHTKSGALVIDMLIPEGRKEMTSQAYLLGRR